MEYTVPISTTNTHGVHSIPQTEYTKPIKNSTKETVVLENHYLQQMQATFRNWIRDIPKLTTITMIHQVENSPNIWHQQAQGTRIQ